MAAHIVLSCSLIISFNEERIPESHERRTWILPAYSSDWFLWFKQNTHKNAQKTKGLKERKKSISFLMMIHDSQEITEQYNWLYLLSISFERKSSQKKKEDVKLLQSSQLKREDVFKARRMNSRKERKEVLLLQVWKCNWNLLFYKHKYR